MPLRLKRSEGMALGGAIALSVCGVLQPVELFDGVKSACLGLGLWWLISMVLLRRRQKAYHHSVLLHLPLVMERIVMACEAGLDTIPALQSLDDAEDPASQALRQVAKSVSSGGIALERSLHDVALKVTTPIFRHVAVHVALAHEQGGALSTSLRELSDATQQLFEQSIDEEIAALPVKATAPLLCVFTGLVLVFVSIPLVEMSKISGASSALGGSNSAALFGEGDEG